MRDLFLKIFLLLVLPASIPAVDLFLALSRWREFRACTAGTTPSALTFGYGELRPGSTQSCMSSGNYSGFTVEKVPLPFANTPAMLLYWNGLSDKSGPFRGKRVLIGQSYPAAVYAYDIDTKKVLWSHAFFEQLPGKNSMPINSSAPVVDRVRGRIYGTFIEEKFAGKKATDSRLTQHYYSIGIDGTGAEHQKVDLAKVLLSKDTTATPQEISKYIRCRTALGLNLEASPPYVYSGCSVARAFSFQGSAFVHQESYQNTKGIRGVLLALPLDPVNGHFDLRKEIGSFIPSKVGPAPEMGVDAGIWHSGGAPTLLPGNHLLFATGNGIFRPDLEVYGCAVLRLNGSTLKLDGNDAYYFSSKGEDVAKAGQLCSISNLDPSSSSLATIERDGRYFSVIGGKDGWLKAFDPLHLPGSSASPSSEAKIVDGHLFGQPVIFPTKRNVGLVSIGGNGGNGLSWAGYKLTESYELRKRWELNSPHPRAFNSSAAGTYTDRGYSPILLIPLISGGPERPFHSSLQVVDAENGNVLDELYYEGNSHFSMPTVVDNEVYLPTTEHGVQVFRANSTFRDFLRHHAWIGRFVSRIVWF